MNKSFAAILLAGTCAACGSDESTITTMEGALRIYMTASSVLYTADYETLYETGSASGSCPDGGSFTAEMSQGMTSSTIRMTFEDCELQGYVLSGDFKKEQKGSFGGSVVTAEETTTGRLDVAGTTDVTREDSGICELNMKQKVTTTIEDAQNAEVTVSGTLCGFQADEATGI